jgi:hypothetical protein
VPIHYIPNDPRAAKFQKVRKQSAMKNRAAAAAQLTFPALPVQSTYPAGNLDWLAWQVRESSLRALAAFEKVDGPLVRWARSINAKNLEVVLVLGNEANAYYDGNKLVFCRVNKGGKYHYTGASTDVVAHETGHAILDALRPDLWDSSYLEVAAFHESFGDCIALLTALADLEIRRDLTRPGALDRANYAETWGEQLAWLAGPGAAPRKALNKLQWHMPTREDEVHDFGQIFTGCFYDLIRLVFETATTKNERALWNATKKAAQLLFSAVRKAPDTYRYFQAVGRVMDIESANDASLQRAVRAAFAQHGLKLGSEAILSPKSRLAGAIVPAPNQHWTLNVDAMADLRSRTGVRELVSVGLRELHLGGQQLLEASYPRAIDISQFGDGSLEGVKAIVPEGVLLGRLTTTAASKSQPTARQTQTVAIMSALPDTVATQNEVAEFVGSLMSRNQISTIPITPVQKYGAVREFGAVRSYGAARGYGRPSDIVEQDIDANVTHQVVEQSDGARTLERLRFACGCRNHRNRTTS